MIRSAIGIAAVLLSYPASADPLASNLSKIRHQDWVLHFLKSIAVRDTETFSKFVSPEARIEGVDARNFKKLSEPLSMENSREMLEQCLLADIGYASTSAGQTSTMVTWNCGAPATKQFMYIELAGGKVVGLNPFGPPAISFTTANGQ